MKADKKKAKDYRLTLLNSKQKNRINKHGIFVDKNKVD